MHTITAIQPKFNSNEMQASITEALKRIAPLWPLEHFVAVNPFLGFTNKPFASACTTLRRTLGHAPVQSKDDYLSMWKKGEITKDDIDYYSNEKWTSERLVKVLENKSKPENPPIATFADFLDQTLPHAHWTRFVAEEISKWCSVHFDRNQTTWASPWRQLGLFAAWKSAAIHDAKPEMFGLPGFRAFVRDLSDDPLTVIQNAYHELSPQIAQPVDFLHCQLASISGWAGHVQYLVREDALRGKDNHALLELLAIRLAYDAALHQAFGDQQPLATWNQQQVTAESADLDQALAHWQCAYERGYQKSLAAQIIKQPTTSTIARPPLQAVFCIDVRSEIMRRHLEAAMPGSHTLGFAGFFGFPVAHQTADACKSLPRCPVLLVPPIESSESRPPNADRQRAEKTAWKAFQSSAASCFTFVESIGLSFGTNLLRLHDTNARPTPAPAPQLANLPAEDRASLAEGALRGMSLTKNFARIILICGHGSHSANNPFGSSLECGACGGHAGDVNARLAAATFNDPEIRTILANRGIHIPDDTVFLAGRHDTLTDDVMLYDIEHAPAGHHTEITTLQAALAKASAATRKERAPRLKLGHLEGLALDHAIRDRGTNIAQLRPEWALANNAALIAAPRSRTAGLNLEGRTFLQEYNPSDDPESKILTVILTAPVVVASWINLQYYGSRVDPENLAAGNKTIHQVVAGIGVIEGNAGDLCGGLPLQSIHDGTKFVHEPRRLTVFIENTPAAIDAVLDAHPQVRDLFDNQWLHLMALTGSTIHQRRGSNHWEEQKNDPKDDSSL